MAAAEQSELKKEEEDIFDSILLAENLKSQEGFDKGLQAASCRDRVQGHLLGWQKGLEVGSEVGQYEGFSQFYIQKLDKEEGQNRPPRLIKSLESLLHLARTFPPSNDPDILSKLEDMRAKYKLCRGLLKLDSKSSHLQLSW